MTRLASTRRVATRRRNSSENLLKCSNNFDILIAIFISSVPRTGLLQTTTYPRRNPQGFNKSKPRNTQHPLTNLPFYKSNYLTSSHRPAEQLSTFYKPSGDSEDEEIVRQYTYSEAIGLQKREPQPWPQQNKHKKVEPPSVMNPFDFPSLPLGKKQEGFKEEEELEYESCTEYQGSFMSSQGGDEEPSVAEIEEHFKRLDMSEQAAASNVQYYPAIDLDDPLFRIEYPEVITDPTQSIPKPLIKPLDQKIFFEVHIMAITSPTRFTFQYDDESRYVLMNAVTNFYSKLPEDDLVISARNLKTGLIVAVNMCNVWHRAQVLSEPLQNQVRVLFVDTGHSDSVSIKNIRYMLQRFIQYPVKSLLGSIAGIRPYFGRTWTVEACESFFDEVADKKVFATIRNFRVSDGVFELEIITKMNKPIFIAEKLCQQRHADTTVIKESFPFGIPMSFAK